MENKDFDVSQQFYCTACEDFRIFRPPKITADLCKLNLDAAYDDNRRFLASAGITSSKKKITGSFIYAHPPDYRGRPSLRYGADDWRKLLRELKEMGMDTVVLQASAWKELGECYYPSKTFSAFKTWNVVEPLLEAANRENMALYLGGLGTVTGWKIGISEADVREGIREQLDCFAELMKLKGGFSGFYLTPETAYSGSRNKSREKMLNKYYKDILSEVKKSKMATLMSPATAYFPGREKEALDFWCTLLDNVAVDILAPQDSIGSGCNRLATQSAAFQTWTAVSSRIKARLWSHVELFLRNDLNNQDNDVLPAEPERVLAQIANAAPWVEKLICWEAPFFLSAEAGPAGIRLREILVNA